MYLRFSFLRLVVYYYSQTPTTNLDLTAVKTSSVIISNPLSAPQSSSSSSPFSPFKSNT